MTSHPAAKATTAGAIRVGSARPHQSVAPTAPKMAALAGPSITALAGHPRSVRHTLRNGKHTTKTRVASAGQASAAARDLEEERRKIWRDAISRSHADLALFAGAASEMILEKSHSPHHERLSRDTIMLALRMNRRPCQPGLGDYADGLRATVGEDGPHVGLVTSYDIPADGSGEGRHLAAGASLFAYLLAAPLVQQAGMRVSLLSVPALDPGRTAGILLGVAAAEGLDALISVCPASVGCDTPAIPAWGQWDVAIESHQRGETIGLPPGTLTFDRTALSAAESFALLRDAIVRAQGRLSPGCSITLKQRSIVEIGTDSADHAGATVVIEAPDADALTHTKEIFVDCCAGASLIAGSSSRIAAAHPTVPSPRHDPTLVSLWARNRRLLNLRVRPHIEAPHASGLAALSHEIPCLQPLFSTSGPVTPDETTAMLRAGIALALTTLEAASALRR